MTQQPADAMPELFKLDAAVEAMVKADDHQTGYERCRWMLKRALPHLPRPSTLSAETAISDEQVHRALDIYTSEHGRDRGRFVPAMRAVLEDFVSAKPTDDGGKS